MFRIQAFLLCPSAPVSFHGTCGIHENAIQIEENRRAVENWHPDLFTTGFAAWGRKATLSVRATARFRSEIRMAWLEFLKSRALVRGKGKLPSFARRTLRLSRSARPHTDFGYFVLEGRRGWVCGGSMVCWALSR